MKCYSFKELNFKYGIFDKSIDCTYILHLENNNRLHNIQIQLKKYKPTKKIFIYLNKGFKTCKKNLFKQQSNYDIIHSYLTIFKHSLKHNFNSILILEDDFIFKRLILQEEISSINNFCLENQQRIFMLSMGIFPILYYSINKDFYKSILSYSSHNMIYSRKMRIKLIKESKKINLCGDFDYYIGNSSYKYFYNKPLIYKKYEKTENQDNWPLKYLKHLILIYIQILNFEKNPENAFLMHYNAFLMHYKISLVMNKLLLISILLIIIYLIYLIYLFTYQNSN